MSKKPHRLPELTKLETLIERVRRVRNMVETRLINKHIPNVVTPITLKIWITALDNALADAEK